MPKGVGTLKMAKNVNVATVSKSRHGYAVLDGLKVKEFSTNREAWRHADILNRETMSRQESVTEWLFKKTLCTL